MVIRGQWPRLTFGSAWPQYNILVCQMALRFKISIKNCSRSGQKTKQIIRGHRRSVTSVDLRKGQSVSHCQQKTHLSPGNTFAFAPERQTLECKQVGSFKFLEYVSNCSKVGYWKFHRDRLQTTWVICEYSRGWHIHLLSGRGIKCTKHVKITYKY